MSPCRQILLSFDKPPQCQANLPSLACHSPLAKSICEVNLATQQGQVNKSMSTWHVDIAKPTLHNTSRYQISYQRSWVHYIMQKFNHPIFVSNNRLAQLVPVITQNLNHTIFILSVAQHTQWQVDQSTCQHCHPGHQHAL